MTTEDSLKNNQLTETKLVDCECLKSSQFSETKLADSSSLNSGQLNEEKLIGGNGQLEGRKLVGEKNRVNLSKPQIERGKAGSTKWQKASEYSRKFRLGRLMAGRQSVIFSTINPCNKEGMSGNPDVCSISPKRRAATAVVSLAGEQVDVLIDTGASVSMVNAEFVRNRRMTMNEPPRNIALKVANNKTMVVNGTTRINFELGSTRIQHEFSVAEGLIHNIILGCDVLRKANVDILLSKGLPGN